jgi:hypothetical protein
MLNGCASFATNHQPQRGCKYIISPPRQVFLQKQHAVMVFFFAAVDLPKEGIVFEKSILAGYFYLKLFC